jgi:hypothetical protein
VKEINISNDEKEELLKALNEDNSIIFEKPSIYIPHNFQRAAAKLWIKKENNLMGRGIFTMVIYETGAFRLQFECTTISSPASGKGGRT